MIRSLCFAPSPRSSPREEGSSRYCHNTNGEPELRYLHVDDFTAERAEDLLHRRILSSGLARALFRAALVFFLGNWRVITLTVANRKANANIASADIRADIAQNLRVIGFDQSVARMFG